MRLIDADALQEWVKKYTSVFARYDWRDILQIIRNAPTVDAEPVRHGHWEKVKEQPYFRKHFHNVACSECHREGVEKWKYCPNCGAKMDVETGNTYSIGKIELPTGVFRQIYDEGRKEDAEKTD